MIKLSITRWASRYLLIVRKFQL